MRILEVTKVKILFIQRLVNESTKKGSLSFKWPLFIDIIQHIFTLLFHLLSWTTSKSIDKYYWTDCGVDHVIYANSHMTFNHVWRGYVSYSKWGRPYIRWNKYIAPLFGLESRFILGGWFWTNIFYSFCYIFACFLTLYWKYLIFVI